MTAATKKVVENRPIPFPAKTPIVTYGEDEDGEVLFRLDQWRRNHLPLRRRLM